jgi:hypothetical protein
MGAGLDPDEDAELRRLHLLQRFGQVAARFGARYADLRGRDRRKAVRDPDDHHAGGRAAGGHDFFSPPHTG